MAATRRQSLALQQHSSGFFGRHDNVFIYVPNLIGYARVLCALYAFAVALRSPTQCATAYFLSFVCDELDGRFARMLSQTSTFGAVLDMVTDRLATTCLLAVLCMLYPMHHIWFLALVMLDVFSHWFQMYATLASGATTHKDVESASFLVRLYYRHRLFMGFCCVACEVLYLCLYLLSWPQFRTWAPLPLPATLQPLLDSWAGVQELPLVGALALAALPGCAVKQLVNVVQLRTAARQLVDYDEQQAARKSAKRS